MRNYSEGWRHLHKKKLSKRKNKLRLKKQHQTPQKFRKRTYKKQPIHRHNKKFRTQPKSPPKLKLNIEFLKPTKPKVYKQFTTNHRSRQKNHQRKGLEQNIDGNFEEYWNNKMKEFNRKMKKRNNYHRTPQLEIKQHFKLKHQRSKVQNQ